MTPESLKQGISISEAIETMKSLEGALLSNNMSKITLTTSQGDEVEIDLTNPHLRGLKREMELMYGAHLIRLRQQFDALT